MELVKENINFANVCGDSLKGFLDRDDDTDLILKDHAWKKNNVSSDEFAYDLGPLIKEEPLGIWDSDSIDMETLEEESERDSLRMNDFDFNNGFADWVGSSVDDNCSNEQEPFLLDAMPSEYVKLEPNFNMEEETNSQCGDLLQDSEWVDSYKESAEDISNESEDQTEANNVSLSCQICKKTFHERMFLYNHLKEFHHCNIIFECDTCRKIFLSKSSLIAHLHTHSQRKAAEKKSSLSDASVESDGEESDDSPQSTVSCEICGKHFIEKIFLYNHLKAYHSCNVIFECDTCHKIFLNDKSLLAHLETHTKKNKRSKLLQCDICSKKFSWQLSLDQHRLKHYFERNYVCHICSKRFSQESELDLHKVSHSSDGLLQCNICLRKFARQCNLVQHKRVHNRTFTPKS